MRRLILPLAVFLACFSVVVVAAAVAFQETFDGTPPNPTAYSNPSNWDIFVQGFNSHYASLNPPIAAMRAQHGPNCEPPGFPYNDTNSHYLHQQSDAVFICNNHIMTSPGLAGYSAIYMTPPAVADWSSGSATIKFDMSTLRTSARDWTDVVITPLAEHSSMAYNNNDQHIPPDNIHFFLAGTNVWLATQRANGPLTYDGTGADVSIPGDGSTTWDQVFADQPNQGTDPGRESAARRDTFEINISNNGSHISMCMPGYQLANGGIFCWINTNLPTPLDPNVWHNQATVMLNHRVYNAEKACSADEDDQNIVHNDYGDVNCPPDTWHWDNVTISPMATYQIIPSVPPQRTINTASATSVNFASPAPANANLSFVQFGHTPSLQVSFDGGTTWQAPRIQPANAPNNGASEENGEMIFTPIPQGVQQVMISGANGFWGTFEVEDLNIYGPADNSFVQPTAVPTATVLPTTTVTPTTTTPTATGTAQATTTATVTPVASVTGTPPVVIQSTVTATATQTIQPTATVTATVGTTPTVTMTATPEPSCEGTIQIDSQGNITGNCN